MSQSACIIVFCIGFYLLGFVASANAATYYVRADGTVLAANKANATSPSSSSTALSLAQVNAATFSSGDQILFSSEGGSYSGELIIPSGGSGTGNEVTYANVPSETPTIATASDTAISTNSKSNIKIIGLSVTYSGTYTNADGILITGTGSSNITISSDTINMGGYGYGIISGAINVSGISMNSDTISNVLSTNHPVYFYGTGASNVTLTNYTDVPNSHGTFLENINGLSVNGFNATGTNQVNLLDIENCSGVVTINNVTMNVVSVGGSGGSGLLLNNCTLATGSTISSSTITSQTTSLNSEIKVSSSTGPLAMNGIILTGVAEGTNSAVLNMQSYSGTVTINNITTNNTSGSYAWGLLFNNCTLGAGSTVTSSTFQNTKGVAVEVSSSTGAVAMSGLNIVGTNGSQIYYSVWFTGSAMTNTTVSAAVASTTDRGFEIDNSSGITIASSSYSGSGTGTSGQGYIINDSNNITVSSSSYSGSSTADPNGGNYGGGFLAWNNSQNITFASDTSNGLGAGGGFSEEDSSNISYTNDTALNGYGFVAATSTTSTSTNISYLWDHAAGTQGQPILNNGFEALGSVSGITYTHSNADYTESLGFAEINNVSNVTLWYDEASYNGMVNVTGNGGAFLPHDNATNVNAYYCIAQGDYNEGFGDVSAGTNVIYNSLNWDNGNILGSTFLGSTVTSPTVGRGGLYFAMPNGTDTFENNISGGGLPVEISNGATEVNGSPVGMTWDYNLYDPTNTTSTFFYDGHIGLSQSWTQYHATNEPDSFIGDPDFVNASSSNFALSYLSPAIDAGTTTPWMTSTTTDYLGNPIYGTPDMGPFEYQPPYTMGTNGIDIGGGARIYGDGKFRTLSLASGNLASLTIMPSAGNFPVYASTTWRPAWLDITNITNWTNAHKTWTESNAESSSMVTDHVVGDLNANADYVFTITGVNATTSIAGINGTACQSSTGAEVCAANASGTLSFAYSGGYSTHTFDLSEVTTPSVSISDPSAGSSVSGTVTITATSTVPSGNAIQSIQFLIDGADVGSAVTSSPWQTSWNSLNVSNGAHTLSAIFTDIYGSTSTSSGVAVTVDNAATATFSMGGGSSLYTVRVNNGASTVSSTDVMLSLYGTEAYTMEVSDTSTFAGATWTPYITSMPWTLDPGAGDQTVYVQFRSVAGTLIGSAQASVDLIPATSSPFGSLAGELQSLEAQLTALEAQASGTTVSLSPYVFSSNLSLGMSANDVKQLQFYLIQRNKGPAAERLGAHGITDYFGPLTKAALIEFQKAVGIHPAIGYFGPITRSWIEAH